MLSVLTTVVLGGIGLLGISSLFGAGASDETRQDPSYVLDFEMERIDGEPQSLDAYEGKVVVFVNVASRCGYTPQYEGLEALYREYKDEGLVVLGFPANNFGGQEPGSEAEILEFCHSRFNVTFPMFAKISVRGEDCHPLYRRLAAQPEPVGGSPRWNFTKFVVDRSGKVVSRFEPGVGPRSDELEGRVRELLAQTGP